MIKLGVQYDKRARGNIPTTQQGEMTMKFTIETAKEWIENSIPGVEASGHDFKFTNQGLGPVRFERVLFLDCGEHDVFDILHRVERVKEWDSAVISNSMKAFSQLVMVRIKPEFRG